VNEPGPESLLPGDIMFGPIGGGVGVLVGLGQLMLGDVSRKDWRVRHVGVIVQASAGAVRLVQAMPSGAEEIDLGRERWTSDYIYVRPRYDSLGAMQLRVAMAARGYVNTPYSFLDYAALAGLHFGIRNGLVRRRVTASKHMICSQLADQAMTDAGHHVFADGRLPQDVTPGELYTAMMQQPGQFFVPGRMNSWAETSSTVR
jgi:hypothetical protein